ncbi:MAG: hypothetical protein AAGH79_15645 [Bacteroidota bacterium]
MIRSILRLAVLLVVGILVYNFFFGTEAEKENSQKVFQEVKEVAISVKDLVKSEREKFDEGKYDQALSKMGDLFGQLKEKAQEVEDNNYLEKLADLDKKRKELEEEWNDHRPETESEQNDFQSELKKLMDETEALIEQ